MIAKLDAALKAGTSVKVVLEKGLNSKSASAGQEVSFKVVEASKLGEMEVARDSRVVGKIIHATAKAKGDADSVLAIDFTTLQPKSGPEHPVMANLQAIAGPEPSAANAPAPGDMTSEEHGGGVAATRYNPKKTVGSDVKGSESPTLTTRHMGSGLPGVALESRILQGRLISVLSTADKSVKLDTNSQVILRIAVP